MTDNLCVCCGRPIQDGYACSSCTNRAAADLRQVIDLIPAARDVAHGLVRRGGGAASGKPGSQPPGDLDAMERLSDAYAKLYFVAEKIWTNRATYPPMTPHADEILVLARWLPDHLEWIRHREDAATMLAGIAEAARIIRTTADLPPASKYLGPCGATLCSLCGGVEPGHVCEGDIPVWTCDGDVRIYPGAGHGVCRTCGARYERGEREAWLEEQVGGSDLAWTARGIADAYGLNVKTLRAWATDRYSGKVLIRQARLSTYWRNADGQLVPWVEPRKGEDVKARGDRLHYVSDVVALAKEAADRREAERARRQEQAA